MFGRTEAGAVPERFYMDLLRSSSALRWEMMLKVSGFRFQVKGGDVYIIYYYRKIIIA